MQSSNIPAKIPLPFANAAGGSYVNTIPVDSQIGITNGRASLADGFPPLTFTPIASGGVPPFGSDMNGILKEITTIQQWQEAGGFFTFDSAFATTVGGYPKGAILQSTSLNGLWMSSIENNSNNPDTGGAGWISLAFEGTQALTVTSADVTVSQLQSAYPVLIVSGALTGNRSLILPTIVGEWIIQNNTTGSYTLTAKTASGTGVTLTQGQSTYVYGDGTNIYFADSAKVASFNGRTGTVTLNATDVTNALGYTPGNVVYTGSLSGSIQYNANIALTVADVGRMTVAGGGSALFTLPPSAGLVIGSVITIVPQGGAHTIQPNGADTIWYVSGNIPSVTIGGVDTATFVYAGSGGWFFHSGNNSLPASPFFTNSLATSGYQKLPSGLIMQWGYTGTITRAYNTYTVTFPVAFPNSFFNASATWQLPSPNNAISAIQIIGWSNSQMVLQNTDPDSDSAAFWFALGN